MSLKSLQTIRERTGAALAHCKRALVDANGDVDVAIALIEERGEAVPENLEPTEVEREAPPPPTAAAAVIAAAEPTVDDEGPLLEAIRAQDAKRTNALLEGRELVSTRVLTTALAYHTGLERVAQLPIAKLAADGHQVARALSNHFGDAALRGQLLGRVLDAMPRGLERTDALQVALGSVHGDRTVVEIPGVHVARKGASTIGAAIRDLAVLIKDGRCVEVREANDTADARAIVESWIGLKPQPPAAFAANAPSVRSEQRTSKPSKPSRPATPSSRRSPMGWLERWATTVSFSDYPSPIVVDGAVWCLVRNESTISPYDLETGEPLWKAPFGASMFGVAVSPELVFVTSSSGITAFRRSDGTVLWTRPSANKMWVWSSPIIDGHRAYYLDHGGAHAVALDDGREVWAVACEVKDYNTLVDLEDRLLVPALNGLLVVEKVGGTVVDRSPVPGDLARRFGGEHPGVVVLRAGSPSVHWSTLDGQSRGSATIASVSDPYGAALTVDRVAVAGARVFAASMDYGLFAFDIDVRGGALQLVREVPDKQFTAIAATDAYVFAHSKGEVTIFDHHLRALGAFATGLSAPATLVPTDDGLFVSTETRAAYFVGAPEDAVRRSISATALAAGIRAELTRLGAHLPETVPLRNVDTPDGGLELSGALSALLATAWSPRTLRRGDPPRELGWEDGAVAEPGLARDYRGPLVLLASDDLGWYYVARAHDASADPLIFSLDQDGGDNLEQGTPLSRFLAEIEVAES